MIEVMDWVENWIARFYHRSSCGMGHNKLGLCGIFAWYPVSSVRPVFSHGVSPWPRTSILCGGGRNDTMLSLDDF